MVSLSSNFGRLTRVNRHQTRRDFQITSPYVLRLRGYTLPCMTSLFGTSRGYNLLFGSIGQPKMIGNLLTGRGRRVIIECRGSLELQLNLFDGLFTAVRDVHIHEDGNTAHPGLSMDTSCEFYRLVSSNLRATKLIFRRQRMRQVYKSFVSYALSVPFEYIWH